MHTGRFVTGMFVWIVSKHAKKGQFRVIQDYRHLMPAQGDNLLGQDAEWEDIRKDVRILVQADNSHAVDDLAMENVAERE